MVSDSSAEARYSLQQSNGNSTEETLTAFFIAELKMPMLPKPPKCLHLTTKGYVGARGGVWLRVYSYHESVSAAVGSSRGLHHAAVCQKRPQGQLNPACCCTPAARRTSGALTTWWTSQNSPGSGAESLAFAWSSSDPRWRTRSQQTEISGRWVPLARRTCTRRKATWGGFWRLPSHPEVYWQFRRSSWWRAAGIPAAGRCGWFPRTPPPSGCGPSGDWRSSSALLSHLTWKKESRLHYRLVLTRANYIETLKLLKFCNKKVCVFNNKWQHVRLPGARG